MRQSRKRVTKTRKRVGRGSVRRPTRASKKHTKISQVAAQLKQETVPVVEVPIIRSPRKWIRPKSWGPIPEGNSGNWVVSTAESVSDDTIASELTKQPKANAPLTFLENILDSFYESEYKGIIPEFYSLLADNQFRQVDVKVCWEHYNSLLKELTDKSPYTKEYYAHLKPRQKSHYVAFLEKLLGDCETYQTNLRKSSKVRRPRRRKLKSADQLSAKVQFKESDPSLKLVSVEPASIVGATACWLFNVKRRRLTYLEAGGTGSLSLKGTTVQRFDHDLSKCKRIRKPETIVDLLTGTKVHMLKAFDRLKVKQIVAKGRINKDTMILKVIK